MRARTSPAPTVRNKLPLVYKNAIRSAQKRGLGDAYAAGDAYSADYSNFDSGGSWGGGWSDAGYNSGGSDYGYSSSFDPNYYTDSYSAPQDTTSAPPSIDFSSLFPGDISNIQSPLSSDSFNWDTSTPPSIDFSSLFPGDISNIQSPLSDVTNPNSFLQTGYDPNTGIMILPNGQAIVAGPQGGVPTEVSTLPNSIPTDGQSLLSKFGNFLKNLLPTGGGAGAGGGASGGGAPAPRVSSASGSGAQQAASWLQQDSLIRGVPNWAVVGFGGFGGLMLIGALRK